jgi:hypothetical protein
LFYASLAGKPKPLQTQLAVEYFRCFARDPFPPGRITVTGLSERYTIMPSKVFISYRRQDSRYQARPMYEAFVEALPPDHVFMDTDSITPGVKFADVLEKWIAQCDVLIALIGPGWINAVDPATGQRRLDNPNDFVRLEIRGALKREIPVVPVLLDATPMPKEDQLPDDIKGLTARNAEQVDFRTFDADVNRLIKKLGLVTPAKPAGGMPKWLPVAAAAVLLAIGAAIYWSSKPPAPPPRSDIVMAELAKSEETRRAAEQQAAAAATAQAAADDARRAAEAKASDAAAALAKSENARRTAEAQATAAARQAADAQAKIAARQADEAAAANKARQDAEQQAAAAVRQAADAQQAAVAARQAADSARAALQARPTPAPAPRSFLDRIGSSSQWSASGSCGNPRDASFYSLAASSATITWTNGLGSVDVEGVVSSDENQFQTTTRMSRHVRGDGVPVGQAWTYSRDGDRIRVRRGTGGAFTLTRCS